MEPAKEPGRSSVSHRDSGEQVVRQVADVIGGLMELWGFKRVMGRTWSVLYLSPEPLTAADLQHILQISAGSVSMTVSELLKWGVIKKTWVPGDRRDHYVPETSIWKMVSRVFRERELVHVREAIDAFRATLGALKALIADAASTASTDDTAASPAGEGPLPSAARLRFMAERLQTLLTLAERGRGLIELLLSGRLPEATELPSTLEPTHLAK